MNILLITSFLPFPLSSGGAQAQYNMIDKLRRKHRLALLYPENEKNRKEALDALKKLWPEVEFYGYPYVRQLMQPSFCMAKVKRALDLKLRPRSPRLLAERTLKPYGFPDNHAFHRFVSDAIKSHKADLVQIDFFPFLHLVNNLPANVNTLFIHHELRYVRNARLLANTELTEKERCLMEQVKQQEIDDLNRFKAVVTLTEIDRQELLRSGVRVPIHVSPAAINSPVLPYEKWNHRIVFIGGYGHTPNKEGLDWLFSQVMPLIDWKNSDCLGMDVIGSGWPAHYADSFDMNGLNVTFHGFVPSLADVARGAILVVPILSGSGMRMKILEGAAQSMPMLTTTVGVEGLDFEAGKSIQVADTPLHFAQALQRLMQDEQLRQLQAISARQLFDNRYSVDALAQTRDEVYAKLN